jgi:hypothetical protein
MDKGLMGTLLRYPHEVRSADEYFDDIQDGKVTKDMLDLARHIINQKAGHFDGAINGKDHRPRDAMVHGYGCHPSIQAAAQGEGRLQGAQAKISVISQDFCQRYLSNPKDPNAFEAGESLQVNGVADRHGPSIDGYNVRYCFCWGLAVSPCIAGQEAFAGEPLARNFAWRAFARSVAYRGRRQETDRQNRCPDLGRKAIAQVKWAASELPDASA